MGWKNVFIKKQYLDFIVDSLIFFQNKRKIYTVGYCIMPNHIHWIIKLSERLCDITKILRTFKSFIATQIIKKMNKEINEDLLPLYHYFTDNPGILIDSPKDLLNYFSKLAINDKDQIHRFWQRDSDVKLITTYKFLRQKLNYIHNNPIQEKWRLVKNPIEYRYSSCKFYEQGSDWNNIQIISLC